MYTNCELNLKNSGYTVDLVSDWNVDVEAETMPENSATRSPLRCAGEAEKKVLTPFCPESR